MNVGKVAYEAYAQFTGGKTFDGREMPTWENLTDRIRSAWEAASTAAREIADFEEVDIETEAADGPVNRWFGLSYSNYLVLPRALMQSMTLGWQGKLVVLLEETDVACGEARITVPVYSVRAVDEPSGRFIKDPIPHYRHAPNLFDGLGGCDTCGVHAAAKEPAP